MGMIYFLDLIQSDAQVGVAVETLTLKEPEAIDAFLQSMGELSLPLPSPRLAAFASKVNKTCGNDVRFLGGNRSEDIVWVDGEPLRPQGPGALRARWSLSFEDEAFEKLMPIVLVWARMARIDVHDPQLGVYFAWRDPHGMARIENPHAPDKTYEELLVRVQVWAAKIAMPPPTVAGIEALVGKLTQQQIRGKRFYQSMSEKLWGRLEAEDPTFKDPQLVFDRDLRKWGGDDNATCSAIWELQIRTTFYPGVLRALKELASERKLCFWVAASGEAYVPSEPQASVSNAPMASVEAQTLPKTAKPLAAPEPALVATEQVRLRRVVHQKEDGSILVALVRDETEPTGTDEHTEGGTNLLASLVSAAINDAQTLPVVSALDARLKRYDFRRKGTDRLERRFPAGVMGLQVLVESLPEGRFGVQLFLTVEYAATQRVLKRAKLAPGDVDLAKRTLVADLRVFEMLTDESDEMVGSDLGKQPYIFTCGSDEELSEQLDAWVMPVMKRILSEKVPWFMDPAKYMGVLHRVFMDGQGWPAGFVVLNMEDIILARLCNMKEWDSFCKLRIQEARKGKHASASSPEALERMVAYVKANVAPNPELEKAFRPRQGGNVLGKAVLAWFSPGLVWLVGSGAGLPKGVLTLMVLICFGYLARQLFILAGGSTLRFLLPFSVLFPPASLLVLAFYGLRKK